MLPARVRQVLSGGVAFVRAVLLCLVCPDFDAAEERASDVQFGWILWFLNWYRELGVAVSVIFLVG